MARHRDNLTSVRTSVTLGVVKEKDMNSIEAVENILREEMITVGVGSRDSATVEIGQMWELDVERLSKRICKLFPKTVEERIWTVKR